MKILRHRKHDDGRYELVVHVDPKAVLDAEHPIVEQGLAQAGDPHPDSVREFTWPSIPPKFDEDGQPTDKPSMSAKDYEAMMLREAKLLIEDELAQAKAPEAAKKLPSEGSEL